MIAGVYVVDSAWQQKPAFSRFNPSMLESWYHPEGTPGIGDTIINCLSTT